MESVENNLRTKKFQLLRDRRGDVFGTAAGMNHHTVRDIAMFDMLTPKGIDHKRPMFEIVFIALCPGELAVSKIMFGNDGVIRRAGGVRTIATRTLSLQFLDQIEGEDAKRQAADPGGRPAAANLANRSLDDQTAGTRELAGNNCKGTFEDTNQRRIGRALRAMRKIADLHARAGVKL